MQTARSILIWAVIALCGVVLITLPVNLQTQLIASTVVVTIMAIIKILKMKKNIINVNRPRAELS